MSKQTTVRKRYDRVFFHGPCSDGVSSLWCAKRYLISGFESVQCRAGSDPEGNFIGERILFVDLCPSLDFIVKFSKKVRLITILDHHKSALDMYNENIQVLDTIPNLELVIDMERAGCQITWDFFFPEVPRPAFINYVADRDLWLWELPNSKEINAAMFENSLFDPLSLDKLDNLLVNPEQKMLELEVQGRIIIKLQKRELDIGIAKAIRCEFQIEDTTYKVWLGGNISMSLRSELGNLLVNRNFPDGTRPDFAVIWVYDFKSNEWWLSFRGGDESPDLSVIARKMGGGGHGLSSGASIKGGKTLCDFFKIL